MRREFLPDPTGYDPYNSASSAWSYDGSAHTLSQIKQLLTPLPGPDLYFPKLPEAGPLEMGDYPWPWM